MSSVFVCGPSSWNTLVYVESLPQPVPHMLHAQGDSQTFGGTSLGKALNLAHLGHQVHLATQHGLDSHGHKISELLKFAHITELNSVDSDDSTATERHLNLMTKQGERISIYLESPAPSLGTKDAQIAAAMSQAHALVMDLSGESRRLLDVAQQQRADIWTDLHDYDGVNEFHAPFAQSAKYVFMNNDAMPDPLPYMRGLVGGGALMAVCTLGAQGALAVTAEGELRVPAVDTVVVDTNGAGDAFMAGVLDATLGGYGPHKALEAGASNAARVLTSANLHPTVDEFFKTGI